MTGHASWSVSTPHRSPSPRSTGLRLAEDLRRRVVAVHAVGLLEGQQLRPRPDVAATVAAARALNPAYSDVEVDTVFEDGAAAEIIARIAEDRRAVLIVVGSRGFGRAAHLLGSTSEAVLARATIPVLIVPAGSSPATSVDTDRVS